jgi:anti-repressor protein
MLKISDSLELSVFNYNKDELRTIIKDGEPWFIAKDVAKILGYNKITKMYDHIDQEDKLEINPQSQEYKGLLQNGATFRLTIINESGLYNAIFGSTMQEAKKFKRWVTHEVLPQIRQTGGYIPIKEEDDELTILSKAILIADNTIKKKDVIIANQEQEIKILKPKADGYDKMVDAGGLLKVGQVAKSLGIGSHELFSILRKNNLLMGNNEPYQRFMTLDQDYFRCKIWKDRLGNRTITPLVTGKGINYIVKLLRKLGHVI